MDNIASAMIKQDPIELERRHKQYLLDMEDFSYNLQKLFAIMPAPDRIYDFSTGEWEVVIKPEWQKRIDYILEARNEFVKQNYPEIYQWQD